MMKVGFQTCMVLCEEVIPKDPEELDMILKSQRNSRANKVSQISVEKVMTPFLKSSEPQSRT